MKKTPPLPAEHYDLSESFSEQPAVQWIARNGALLATILLGLVLLGLGYARWNQNSGSSTDYVAAETAFRQFSQSTEEQNQIKAYNQLLALLNQKPELHAKYDGLIGQILLNREKTAEAKEYIAATLRRTQDEGLEPFANYSRTTVVMSGDPKEYAKNFAKALEQTNSLRQQLVAMQTANPTEEGQTLYLFNLIRIAFIYRELGQKADELKTWKEFKAAPVQSANNPLKVDSWVYEQVVDNLGSGKGTLLNYIDEREKLLNN